MHVYAALLMNEMCDRAWVHVCSTAWGNKYA
jgi:hypothetical protein